MWPFTKSEKWFTGASGTITFFNYAAKDAEIIFFRDYLKSIKNIKNLRKQGMYFDFEKLSYYLAEYSKRFTKGVDFNSMNHNAIVSFKRMMNVDGRSNQFLTYLQNINHSLYGIPLAIVADLFEADKIKASDKWLYDTKLFTGDVNSVAVDNTNQSSADKIISKMVELGIEIEE